jgi:hypothetical protein
MKKLVAISLLSLLIFDAFGRYFLLFCEQEEATVMNARNRLDEELVVPVHAYIADMDVEFLNDDLTVRCKEFLIAERFMELDTLSMFAVRGQSQDNLRVSLDRIIEGYKLYSSTAHKSPVQKALSLTFAQDYIPASHLLTLDGAARANADYKVRILITDEAALSADLALFSPPPERA